MSSHSLGSYYNLDLSFGFDLDLAVVGATVTVTEWSNLRYFGLSPGTARLLISKIRAVNLFDLYLLKDRDRDL